MKKQAAKIRLQKGLTAKRTDTLELKIQDQSPAPPNIGFAMEALMKAKLHTTIHNAERRKKPAQLATWGSIIYVMSLAIEANHHANPIGTA